MDIQTIIAVAALIIAVVSFFANLWYTRRQFLIATLPSLRAELKFNMQQRYSDDETIFVGLIGTTINVEVENLSNSVSISEVELTVEVRLKKKNINWQTLYKERIDSISPLRSVTPSMGNLRLEYMLSGQFPGFFRELEDFYATENLWDRTVAFPPGRDDKGRPAERKQNAYQILSPCRVDILYRLNFRPAVYRAKISTITRHYRLSPVRQPSEMFSNFLAGWEIEKL